MAPVKVRVAGADIELDYTMIGGALDLMAFTYGNNLDLETIRRADELKRMVAQKSKDESQGKKKLLRVKVNTVPNKSRCKGNEKRKIWKSASSSGAGPSSDQPAFTSGAGPSSDRSSYQPGSTSGAGPSSAQPEVEPGQSSSSSLPAGIQDLIGWCSIPIRKKIFASDVDRGLCRLMLPKCPVEEHLIDVLNPDYENIEKGIPVTVYGPDGREYDMIDFKLWSEKFYVLNSYGWKQFCKDYGLASLINMATLTIRMFRHRKTNDLCFAITW